MEGSRGRMGSRLVEGSRSRMGSRLHAGFSRSI